jgi:hypothetical protein
LEPGVTIQLAALQQTLPLHAEVSAHDALHWLPEGPPHVTDDLQAFMAQLTVELADWQSTELWQAPTPQVTLHDCVAVHVTELLHEFMPQLTVHVVPPQVMLLWHAPTPHSMSQLDDFEQSMLLSHPPSPHWTTHGRPAGQVTLEEHLPPVQSITQRPLASQVPPGQDCAEQAAPDGPFEELQAAKRTRRPNQERVRSSM